VRFRSFADPVMTRSGLYEGLARAAPPWRTRYQPPQRRVHAALESRGAYPAVDDKLLTKDLCARAGIPTPQCSLSRASISSCAGCAKRWQG